MIKEYILKHKNNDVIIFEMDNIKYNVLGIKNIINKERLPFGLIYGNNILQCGIQLDAWIKGRGIADSRNDKNNIKLLFDVKDTYELTVKSMGLNVTDHFWFHDTNLDIKWENVNFFENYFDKIKVTENHDPSIDKNVKIPSPNFCVDGSIEKRWIINENNDRVLLKGSRIKGRMQEPFNESIASLIMKEMGIKCVEYLLRKNIDIPYSECKTMSDKNYEYINAKWIFDKEDYGFKDIYKYYIETCINNGIDYAKEKIDEMIAIDFLIGNVDRHKGNFGIIRNSENLKWEKIANIFDNGNSLFFDIDDNLINEHGIDTLCKSFDGSNRLQLEVIDYPQWYNESKGKNIIEIVNEGLSKNVLLKNERIEKILSVVKERIKVFEKIINNKKR